MTLKKSRRRFLAGSGIALTSLAVWPHGVRAAEFEWKYGIDLGPDDPIVATSVEAFAKIRADTGGRLAIKAFPSSTLGGTAAMLTQLRTGALEVLGFTGTNLDAIVPIAAITSVGFAFKDVANACEAFDGDLGAMVRREILTKAIVPVGRVFSPGFNQLHLLTKAIRNADDLVGLKIRVPPSKNNIELMKLVGASPVALSTNEVFTALSTHLIDGVSTSINAVASIGWAPVIKYISLTNHQWNCIWTLFNQDKWQSLPANVQAIVEKHMDEAVVAQRRETPKHEVSLLEKFQRSGIAVNTPDISGFKAKLKSGGYYTEQRDQFGPAAWTALAKYSEAVRTGSL